MNDHLAKFTTLNGRPLDAIEAEHTLRRVIEIAAQRIAEIRGFALDSVNIKLKERPS